MMDERVPSASLIAAIEVLLCIFRQLIFVNFDIFKEENFFN